MQNGLQIMEPNALERPVGGSETRPIQLPFEFCCWCAVVFVPVLCWLNGPPVSGEQQFFRAAVFVLVAGGAMGATLVRLVSKRSSGE